MFQSAGSASRCLSLARAVDSPPTTYGHEITIMGFVSRDLHTYLVHAKWFFGIFGSAMPNRTSWPLTSLYQVPTKPVAGYHYRHSLVFKYYLLLVVLFGVLCILPVFLLWVLTAASRHDFCGEFSRTTTLLVFGGRSMKKEHAVLSQ